MPTLPRGGVPFNRVLLAVQADTSHTDLTYSNGNVTATNSVYSGKLFKADAEKASEIVQKLRTAIQSNLELEFEGGTPPDFGEDDIR